MRQFRQNDSVSFSPRYGDGSDGSKTVSADETYDGANAGLVGSYTADPLVTNPTLTIDTPSTFTNGMLVMIHQSRGGNYGSWEINRIRSGGGTTALELDFPLQNNYVDDGTNGTAAYYDFTKQAQIIEMKQWTDVTIDATKTLSAPYWDGSKGGIIAFFASGNLDVNGAITASQRGFRGGYRQDVSGNDGESVNGWFQHSQPNINGGGGGTKAESGAGGGGGGGNGLPGSNGQTINSGTGGTGGILVGQADCTVMVFGGGGGMGGDGWQGGSNGAGGKGGGIVLIIAKTVDVDNSSGFITADGEAGGNGDSAGNQKAAAGGGGGGGVILIKSQTITANTTRIRAIGGTGGSQGHSNGGAGGGGGTGRINFDYFASTGTTNPTYNANQNELYSDLYAHESIFSNHNAALAQEKYKRQVKVGML